MKEKVAEKIRIARLSKNFSQQNMADELSITVAAYSNIERGITDISLSRLFQIAEILNLSPTELMYQIQENMVSEKTNPTENYTSSLTQQVYMLIQDVQSLKTQVFRLQKELEQLKKKL